MDRRARSDSAAVATPSPVTQLVGHRRHDRRDRRPGGSRRRRQRRDHVGEQGRGDMEQHVRDPGVPGVDRPRHLRRDMEQRAGQPVPGLDCRGRHAGERGRGLHVHGIRRVMAGVAGTRPGPRIRVPGRTACPNGRQLLAVRAAGCIPVYGLVFRGEPAHAHDPRHGVEGSAGHHRGCVRSARRSGCSNARADPGRDPDADRNPRADPGRDPDADRHPRADPGRDPTPTPPPGRDPDADRPPPRRPRSRPRRRRQLPRRPRSRPRRRPPLPRRPPTPTPTPTPTPAPALLSDHYVAPGGRDTAAGTLAAPWGTLAGAISKLKAGAHALRPGRHLRRDHEDRLRHRRRNRGGPDHDHQLPRREAGLHLERAPG